MNNVIMRGQDAMSARKGEVFFTVGDRRFNLASIINLDASVTKNKAQVPILGRTMDSHKTISLAGEFSGILHFNQSVLRKLVKEYQMTGIDSYFTIQVTNEDPETKLGRQTIVLKDCNLDEVLLFKLDADGDYLEEDISGTFEDFSILEEFNEL